MSKEERDTLSELRKAAGISLPIHPLIFLGGFLMVGLLFALQEWVNVRHLNLPISVDLLLKAWGVHYLLWGLLCWLSWRVLGHWLEQTTALAALLGLVPLSITLSVLEEMIWVMCFPGLPLWKPPMDFYHRLAFYLQSELVDGVMIFWCSFLLLRGIVYYQRFREQLDTAAQLKVELAQAQLHALRMHLNPHFLFNTLNSISSLMRTDLEGADIMIEQFSSLLRITLDRGDVQLIPLRDEMEFVEMYLAMQNRRFSGRIRQQIRIDPELHDALVPAMILQPIVENAYGHGLSRLQGNGLLKIEATRKESWICISVLNSGLGLSPSPPESSSGRGIGLSNITNRLRLHYRDDHAFEICEVAPNKVNVTMTFPLQICPNPVQVPAAYGA